MTAFKKGQFNLFRNVKTQVFVQFILIFLIIISVILFSSSSFYKSMIEILDMFTMRKATSELSETDIYDDSALDIITDIERRHGLFVEIYAKDNRSDEEYTQPVYAKCFHGILSGDTSSINFTEDFEPIVNYAQSDFTLIQKYDDGSFAGISENTMTGSAHFVLATPDTNKDVIYITAINYSLIDGQASTISIAAIIITIIIFISVSIAIYFYITQVTKPLSNIIKVTKVMANEQDKSIRIPIRNNLIKTGTDDAIVNINMLYEDLIHTQESLLEKSEILAAQLAQKNSEQKSREEFIAGTSHELKTPISIIQGYAEGIKYLLNDKQSINEYCDTIIEECGKMTDLVVNMMSLSELQQNNNMSFSEFCINDFIDERLEHHKNIFNKNGIQAESLLKEKLYGYADVHKLQFVINNLLSNAISYIDGNPKIINVSCEDVGLSYRVFVYNTGKHIPRSELQKLWMSFYRRDDARLRSEGHFGLGLTIVKTVQDAHSQQCGVDNADGGVRFWFDIAKEKNI